MGLTRSCIEGGLAAPVPHGAWWMNASLASHLVDAHWMASGPHRRDSELFGCYTATRSSNSRISRWVLRSLGVTGASRARLP
jgi:hypothetical protein